MGAQGKREVKLMRNRFVPLLVLVGLKAKEKQAILRTGKRGEESCGVGRGESDEGSCSQSSRET